MTPAQMDTQFMGRPPKVTDDELVEALQNALDWPEVAAVGTDSVSSELDSVPRQTVRNRLKTARGDSDVPVGGFRPGEQGGWAWWLTDASLYENCITK